MSIHDDLLKLSEAEHCIAQALLLTRRETGLTTEQLAKQSLRAIGDLLSQSLSIVQRLIDELSTEARF